MPHNFLVTLPPLTSSRLISPHTHDQQAKQVVADYLIPK